MEKVMAHILKYLERDTQHKMGKYMGLHPYCWSQERSRYSDWIQAGWQGSEFMSQ
jgi:hypothetical protein